MVQRKGQFEMIPDFLKKKELQRDFTALQEDDLMQNAFKKQEAQNQEGPSMSELFAQKRRETEKALEEKKSNAPSNTEIEDRKARLLAQRDALRKAKEQKRQEQLEEFKAKTETKEDLFAELKKMDANLEQKKKEKEHKQRLEMMRKARQDVENENRQAYEKKAAELDKKDKEKQEQPAGGDGDWLDNLKTYDINQ